MRGSLKAQNQLNKRLWFQLKEFRNLRKFLNSSYNDFGDN